MTKHEIRREIFQQRDSMTPEEVREKSEKVCLYLEEYTNDERCKTVMVYLPTGNETDIWPLIKKLLTQGKRIAAPLCVSPGVMVPCLIDDLEKDIAPGFYGIMAPIQRREIPLDEIDLIIIPGVGFDREGNRLGYGGGYYDRFLPRLRKNCDKIAICYEFQMRDDLVPEPHDFPIAIIITENGILKIPE
ncbi:MAG TPA: 5-formyltetrahydrofolate cyclo-ligase [Firmicutes bacterium]|nr:5-formyltetrahydrofolate cyclo-ligase [Bacillota bacterium]